MKTIIFFVFGLLSWLLLTNYQLVYSKVTSFTNPVQESNLVVASVDTNASSALEELYEDNISEEELGSDTRNAAQDEVSSLESELTEKTESVVDKTSANNAELSSNDAITEKLDENLETIEGTTKSETELESETEVGSEIEKEIEQQPKAETNSSNTPAASQAHMNNPWMQFMQPNTVMPTFNQNMMNSGMMNPGMFVNPMAMMTPMMMSMMMGPMMNPAMMMNPNAMINHPINTMTHPQNMNAMMMSMDPKMMFSMFGQPSKEYLEGEVPDQLPVVTIPGMPTQTYQNWPVNKLSPGVSREAKKNAFQTAMAMSPLNMRDMLGIMADKMPVDEGVTWDDAVEAMKLRANEVNFKFVGSSPLWKQIEAETEQPSAKVEMFRFCDATVARKILDVVPEFIIFLPCKIALLEDGEGKLWVMTMDWDVSWLDFAQNPNSHLSKEIREDAKRIRDNLSYIMEGAATGDF
ncbi:MAG: DUF302 domain-containing protein [Gammaproteobacteria bacterium]|nr:DUF302 domain-containing protein [Gammaproteobacteria bacterium]